MKKSLYILAALSILLSFSCTPQRKLTIIHYNDTHSHFEPLRGGVENEGMGGVIERAVYIDSVRKAEGPENVLLLHAGDFGQGTSYFTVLEGDLEIATINAMKYDVVCLGNHEFDNGLDEMARRLSMLNCPVICSNYDFSKFEVGKYIRPYAVVEKAGLRIGLFSLLTDVTRMVERSISKDMEKFDDVQTAQKWADYLRNEQRCDLVIALNHIGYEGEPFTDPDLAKATRGIDLIVGGHSHTFLEKMEYVTNLDGKRVPIVQDGCWGLYSGKITYLEDNAL